MKKPSWCKDKAFPLCQPKSPIKKYCEPCAYNKNLCKGCVLGIEGHCGKTKNEIEYHCEKRAKAFATIQVDIRTGKAVSND